MMGLGLSPGQALSGPSSGELVEHEQVGLPPAILKHAGGMFPLFIIERRTAWAASFDAGPFDAACGVAQDMLHQAQSLLRMSGVGIAPAEIPVRVAPPGGLC